MDRRTNEQLNRTELLAGFRGRESSGTKKTRPV